MDQDPLFGTPQSIYHTFQLFDQESSNCLFLFKSCLEQLKDSFSKKNPHFNIIEDISNSFVQINGNKNSETENENLCINNENSYVSGFPGTQLDSLSSFSQSLKELSEYSRSIKKIINSIDEFLCQANTKTEKKQNKKKHKKSKETDLFDDLNDKKGKILLIYNSIMGIKELLTTAAPEKEKKAQKIVKKMEEKIQNGHCKPATATKLVSELTDVRTNPEKLELLKKLDEYYIQFHENISDAVKSFCVRYKFMKKIFKKYVKKNVKFIEKLNMLIPIVSQKSLDINFEKDFSHFVAKKKIIRYDLKCEAFKPIDMSHPVFNNFEPSKIHNIVAVPPVYPIAMAKVINSFTATNANEITIVKGKMVLIMEPLDNPWTLVMNPFTTQTGFVPSMNLEVVGSALGIITKEALSSDGISLLVGDYVAILKMKVNKNAPYLTHSPTYKRRKSTLKRTENNSARTSSVFDSISNYIQGTNNAAGDNNDDSSDKVNNSNKDLEKESNEKDSPKKSDVIEVNEEFDIKEDEDSNSESNSLFTERLDDGISRNVVTVNGENTKVDLENVGIIYD